MKIRNKILILVSILLFFSCGYKEQNTKTVALKMSEDSLVSIMVDLQIADQAVKVADIKSRDSMKHLYFNQMLRIYNIDSAFLYENLNLLQEDKDLYLRLQTRVVDTLKVMEKVK
jgi:hypothetical protein